MKSIMLVSALLAFVIGPVHAGDGRWNVVIPAINATYANSNIVVGATMGATYGHQHHHYPHYGHKTGFTGNPVGAIYASPVIAYAPPPVIVYNQTDPMVELRSVCGPNVTKVCSGATCVFCN